jgi:hypothetical protein
VSTYANRRGTIFDRANRLRGADVCRIAGVTYRQLDYWARLGHFGDALIGQGSGGRRSWRPEHVALSCGLGMLASLNATNDVLALFVERADLAVPQLPGGDYVSTFVYVVPDCCVDEFPPASWIRPMYVIPRKPMHDAFFAAQELIDARHEAVC